MRAKPNLLVLLPAEGSVGDASLMYRRSTDSVLFFFVFKNFKNYIRRVSRCCFLSDVRCLAHGVVSLSQDDVTRELPDERFLA